MELLLGTVLLIIYLTYLIKKHSTKNEKQEIINHLDEQIAIKEHELRILESKLNLYKSGIEYLKK